MVISVSLYGDLDFTLQITLNKYSFVALSRGGVHGVTSFYIIDSVCDVFLFYKDVEHHRGNLIVAKMDMSAVPGRIQISFARDVKWVYYTTIMV